MDENAIDLAGSDVGEQALQGRTVHAAATEAAIVVVFGNGYPAGMTLTGDVGLAGIALGIQGIEFLFQAFFGGFAGVDGTADGGLVPGIHGWPPWAWRPRWKNQKPLQWLPVISLARALNEEKTLPWYWNPCDEHLHVDGLSLVGAGEPGTRRRQPWIPGGSGLGTGLGLLLGEQRRRRSCLAAWRREAQVGIAGQFGGTLAGTVGEIAFGQGLQTPGDAFEQPGFVMGVGSLANDVQVALAKLHGGQTVEVEAIRGRCP